MTVYSEVKSELHISLYRAGAYPSTRAHGTPSMQVFSRYPYQAALESLVQCRYNRASFSLALSLPFSYLGPMKSCRPNYLHESWPRGIPREGVIMCAMCIDFCTVTGHDMPGTQGHGTAWPRPRFQVITSEACFDVRVPTREYPTVDTCNSTS